MVFGNGGISMDISKLETRDQLLISLAMLDIEAARRIVPDHQIFTREDPPLAVSWVGGACPTQSEGEMSGEPYYFRARHGDWYLNIGGADIFKPVFRMTGDDPSCGFMEDDEVMPVLLTGARMVAYLKEAGAWAGTRAEEDAMS